VEEIESTLLPQIKSAHIAFRVAVSNSLPKEVKADKDRLEQVLLNLLLNA
jgi:signal transduction histidine kinase